jgi:hypothetical protein
MVPGSEPKAVVASEGAESVLSREMEKKTLCG